MSLHMCVIAIEGQAETAVPDFFQRCRYELLEDEPLTADSFGVTMQAIEDSERKAVCTVDGWTAILDREMVLSEEDDSLAELSAERGRVIMLLAESVSDTYGYALYEKGEKVRGLLVVDGEVSEEFGLPVEAEEYLDLVQEGEDAVLAFAQAYGFTFDAVANATCFHLYDLEYEEPRVVDQDDIDELEEEEEVELDEADYLAGNTSMADPVGDTILTPEEEDEFDPAMAPTMIMMREEDLEELPDEDEQEPVTSSGDKARKPWWRFW